MGFPVGMGPPGGFSGQGNTGLPFAGIPPEYAEHVDALLADEEETPIPDVDFDHVDPGPAWKDRTVTDPPPKKAPVAGPGLSP